MPSVLMVNLLTLSPSNYFLSGHRIWDLEFNDDRFKEEAANWTNKYLVGPHIYSQCADTYFVGGYKVVDTDSDYIRTYKDLPPHDIIYFSIYVTLIDKWMPLSNMYFLFDRRAYAVPVFLLDYTHDFPTDICGDPAINDLHEINIIGKVKHPNPELTLRIGTVTHYDPSVRSFGFRDIILLFRNATEDEVAQVCGNSDVTLPLSECACKEGQFKPLVSPCEQCNAACQTCMGSSPSQCFECSNQYFYDGWECTKCMDYCLTCSTDLGGKCTKCESGAILDLEGNCQSKRI